MNFSDRLALAAIKAKWMNGYKFNDDDIQILLDIIKKLDDKLDSIQNNN